MILSLLKQCDRVFITALPHILWKCRVKKFLFTLGSVVWVPPVPNTINIIQVQKYYERHLFPECKCCFCQNATKYCHSHWAEKETRKTWLPSKLLSHGWVIESLVSNMNNHKCLLTIVGLPLLMSCPTSWKMLLQLILLSTVPLFTMTATARRICSRTYFWRLEKKSGINVANVYT